MKNVFLICELYVGCIMLTFAPIAENTNELVFEPLLFEYRGWGKIYGGSDVELGQLGSLLPFVVEDSPTINSVYYQFYQLLGFGSQQFAIEIAGDHSNPDVFFPADVEWRDDLQSYNQNTITVANNWSREAYNAAGDYTRWTSLAVSNTDPYAGYLDDTGYDAFIGFISDVDKSKFKKVGERQIKAVIKMPETRK